MHEEVRRRQTWVRMYFATHNAGLVCRRCGVSRPTLRKWIHRYRDGGEAALADRSRRPRRSPKQKIFNDQRELILEMRRQQNIGARRIQCELRLHHQIELSITSVQRILNQADVRPLRKPRRSLPFTRYNRPLPGDRVQMDTMKVAPGVYQYTAVDDCSRFRVLGVFPRRSAGYTIQFLERVVEEMPFAIQRIQTDRGREFFAECVQRWLMNYAIKFRPNPPRSPHLNGKVERSQLTDLLEFWTRIEPRDPEAAQKIEEWQFDYNWRRPHGSLGGKTPIDRTCELSDRTPTHEEVSALYDPARERIRHPDFRMDQKLAALFATHRASVAKGK